MMEYRETIRRFIINNFLFEDGSQLHDSDSLLDTGVIDSTGVLELLFFLEKTYQVTIAPAELTPDNLDSVERISQFIARKCSSRTPPASRPEPGPLPGEHLGAAAEKH